VPTERGNCDTIACERLGGLFQELPAGIPGAPLGRLHDADIKDTGVVDVEGVA